MYNFFLLNFFHWTPYNKCLTFLNFSLCTLKLLHVIINHFNLDDFVFGIMQHLSLDIFIENLGQSCNTMMIFSCRVGDGCMKQKWGERLFPACRGIFRDFFDRLGK